MSLIFQWIKKIPSIFDENVDAPIPSIDSDIQGNVYVAYVTKQPETGETNVGKIDICVGKFDTDGNNLWFRQRPSFDTTDDDVDPCLCVDLSGNVYVVYCTPGEISGQTELVNSSEIVVFKLDTQGNTQWVKQSQDFNTNGQNYSPSIASDELGNVYVAYYAKDPTSPSEYYDNVNIFKLSTGGNFLWAKKTGMYNSPGGNYQPSIDVDSLGNCYVAYFCDGYQGPASGGSESGGADIVIFKTDTNGNTLWIRQQPSFNTSVYDLSPSLVTDVNGSCYVAYYTLGITSGNATTGEYDVVVAKINSKGDILWVVQQPTFNTNQTETSPSIGVDAMGIIYLTYNTYGAMSGQVKQGLPDVVICRMNNSGEVIDVLQQSLFNTMYENVYPVITVDLFGNCYVAYYSVNPGLQVVGSSQELVIFKMSSVVCVSSDTLISMADGTAKQIKYIQRGDVVAPNYTVARLCQERIDQQSYIDLVIMKKNCLGITPTQDLIITPNHPIFYRKARRPAMCFEWCPNVEMIHSTNVEQLTHILGSDPDIYLYDLQFEHDGSYIANGVEIQSRSPNSCIGPLPKELYFDELLYNNARVWDSIDQYFPLISEKINFNVVVLKNNKKHNIKNNTETITKYKQK